MNDVLIGLLCFVSIFEVWMMYQLLFNTLIDTTYFGYKEKAIIWLSSLIIGGLTGINREMLFFSSLLFVIHTIFLIFLVSRLQQKNIGTMSGIIVVYFTIIAILDYVWAFLSMILLDQSFINEVHSGVSIEKLVIFSLSRCLMIPILLICKRKNWMFNNITEYKKLIWGLGFILFVILIRYQFWMVDMVQLAVPMEGLAAGSSILLLLVLVLLFAYFILKSSFFQKEHELLKTKDEMMSRHYQELLQGMERNRHLIHDIRHHILILQQYDQDQEYGKLRDYLEKMNDEIQENRNPIFTGNRIVDFILNQKRQVAENKGIQFTTESQIIFSHPLEDKDICVLLGNLLDNAIEAAEKTKDKNPWIRIRFEKIEEMFFIEISNSHSGNIIKSKGNFISSKKDKDMHGYGLKSVKRIVSEYEGEITFNEKNDQFIVSISFFSN